MARIRSIKPDFWTDEKVVELSPFARLLFIGLWNFVDDEGRMTYSPLSIKLKILPADSLDISELLGEIRGKSLITVYPVDGIEYLQVNGFASHQKIDKRTPSKLPPPPNSPEKPPRKGREGKGSYMSDKSDDAEKVLDYLNEKTGSAYRKVDSNVRLVAGRLKEGASFDDCIAVIDDRVTAWGSDPKMAEFLRPKTLFSPTNFNNYVGAIGKQVGVRVDA